MFGALIVQMLLNLSEFQVIHLVQQIFVIRQLAPDAENVILTTTHVLVL